MTKETIQLLQANGVQVKPQDLVEFKTLDEAVNAASLDRSYNPSIAKRTIKESSTEGGRYFVDYDAGEVFYTFQSDDIRLLNKLSLFHSCLSSEGFRQVDIPEPTPTGEGPIRIHILGTLHPNNPQTRRWLASMRLTMTSHNF